jgi:competence protein ComEC
MANYDTIPVTVLKVGHHGSRTSSTERFLNFINPQIALITCAQDNSYGHPHIEVLERLQALDVAIFRTDLQGSISIVSDGNTLQIHTER